jgi:hypothetical protein
VALERTPDAVEVSISASEGTLAVRRVVALDVGATELEVERLVKPGKPLRIVVSIPGSETTSGLR